MLLLAKLTVILAVRHQYHYITDGAPTKNIMLGTSRQ